MPKSNEPKLLTAFQIDDYCDSWLVFIYQLQIHGVITSHQKGALTRKVKVWAFDQLDKLEEANHER